MLAYWRGINRIAVNAHDASEPLTSLMMHRFGVPGCAAPPSNLPCFRQSYASILAIECSDQIPRDQSLMLVAQTGKKYSLRIATLIHVIEYEDALSYPPNQRLIVFAVVDHP